MRTIELHLPHEFWLKMMPWKDAVHNAVGYLATYGLGMEPQWSVQIFPERGTNIEASYHRPDGTLAFFLHAQWDEHEESYSFHS